MTSPKVECNCPTILRPANAKLGRCPIHDKLEIDMLVREAAKQASTYEEVLKNFRRLVRELDVVLNGENAAEQASLSDLVQQVRQQKAKSAPTSQVVAWGLFAKVDGKWVLQHPVRFNQDVAEHDRKYFQAGTDLAVRPLYAYTAVRGDKLPTDTDILHARLYRKLRGWGQEPEDGKPWLKVVRAGAGSSSNRSAVGGDELDTLILIELGEQQP